MSAVQCLAPTVIDGGRPCRRRVIKVHERDREFAESITSLAVAVWMGRVLA